MGTVAVVPEVAEDGSHAARGARRRARTRTRVLDGAEKLLSERAAEEIRVEDVAAESGVSPASIYVHFGTKDALLAAVVQRLLEIGSTRMREAYTADADPVERFGLAGIAYVRLLLDHPALIKYVAATGERAPESDLEQEAQAAMMALRAEFEASIEAMLEATGRSALDARLMSYFLFGAWNGVAALTLRRDGLALSPAEVEAAVLQAGETLLRGLGASPIRLG